jgi:hypothetical protein
VTVAMEDPPFIKDVSIKIYLNTIYYQGCSIAMFD